jgi:hypothetical protein
MDVWPRRRRVGGPRQAARRRAAPSRTRWTRGTGVRKTAAGAARIPELHFSPIASSVPIAGKDLVRQLEQAQGVFCKF